MTEERPSPFSRDGVDNAGASTPAVAAPPQPAQPVYPEQPVQASWSPYQVGDPTAYGAPAQPPMSPTPYGTNPYEVGPYQPGYGGSTSYGVPAVQNQKALLALIFGIAGFVLVSAVVGGLIGIAGIVLGVKARREIDAEPQRYTGRAMATAGFWLGLVGTVGSLLFTVGLILLFVYAPESGF